MIKFMIKNKTHLRKAISLKRLYLLAIKLNDKKLLENDGKGAPSVGEYLMYVSAHLNDNL